MGVYFLAVFVVAVRVAGGRNGGGAVWVDFTGHATGVVAVAELVDGAEQGVGFVESGLGVFDVAGMTETGDGREGAEFTKHHPFDHFVGELLILRHPFVETEDVGPILHDSDFRHRAGTVARSVLAFAGSIGGRDDVQGGRVAVAFGRTRLGFSSGGHGRCS